MQFYADVEGPSRAKIRKMLAEMGKNSKKASANTCKDAQHPLMKNLGLTWVI